jgi:hypothetical protein
VIAVLFEGKLRWFEPLQFLRTELSSSTMDLLQTVIVYTIACIFGMYIFERLASCYICNPSASRVKKRDQPPACLTDPQHGNHGYLSLKDIKTHYVVKGDKSKPFMLFLHGFPEFWYSCSHQIKEVSKDYWAVAIELRGYGVRKAVWCQELQHELSG